MRRALLVLVAACGSREAAVPIANVQVPQREARLPRAPGPHAPSFVAIANQRDAAPGGDLADVDSCSTCHPDVAAQWAASAHSFASFGNPIYRYDVEQVRAELGKPASNHCGGCHDMPLLVDGLMTGDAPIPATDLRAHSGVTCRLCHGVQSTSFDGNGSYVWDATPIDAPALDDPAAIARHKRQVTTKVDAELCIGCHRGFLSPDMGLPAQLAGIDDTGAWLASAWTGNGMARLDRVDRKTCIDCHMERVVASKDELGAKRGTVASHRFVGGHTWMAGMRGDTEQLRLTQAKLAGVASIDIAGARVIERSGSAGPRRAAEGRGGGSIARGVTSDWYLPADGAPARAGTRVELDVVVRNLLAGHRFPGGLGDVQDTWIEVEVADARGRRLASSGLAHATDPDDRDAHVLRSLVVDDRGELQLDHELAKFRATIAVQTLAAREAQAVRYGFDVPAAAAQPLTVTARLRHRSRNLHVQAQACRAATRPDGQAFLAGARRARDVELDPCRVQPITLIAQAQIELGVAARSTSARPAWERTYELGMALASTIVTRLGEARTVLGRALAIAPGARAQAMVEVQLGWVASRQHRVDEAIAHVERARELLGHPQPEPPVFAAVLADAYTRVDRWSDAVAPARSCTERAPDNASAWSLYARVLVAAGDHASALAAATRGLVLAPRDPQLLAAQATSLAALHDPRAAAAQAAYTRYRPPDDAAALRIRCATHSPACWRDRNPVQTLELHRDR
ncbi:MAG: multiheme c-type cytochrome [Acidobacteriota bacterium]